MFWDEHLKFRCQPGLKSPPNFRGCHALVFSCEQISSPWRCIRRFRLSPVPPLLESRLPTHYMGVNADGKKARKAQPYRLEECALLNRLPSFRDAMVSLRSKLQESLNPGPAATESRLIRT